MRLLFQKAFEEYWEAGGFPREAGLPRHSRTKTHREYFHTTLYRGVAECSDVSHPKAVAGLAHRLMDDSLWRPLKP